MTWSPFVFAAQNFSHEEKLYDLVSDFDVGSSPWFFYSLREKDV